MKTITILALSAFLTLGLGCGKDDKKGGGDDMNALAQDLVKVFSEMVDVITKNTNDCKAMADGLSKIAKANEDKLKKGQEIKKQMKGKKEGEKPNIKIDPKIEADIKKNMGGLIGGMLKCGNDPAFADFNKNYAQYFK